MKQTSIGTVVHAKAEKPVLASLPTNEVKGACVVGMLTLFDISETRRRCSLFLFFCLSSRARRVDHGSVLVL